MDLQLDPAERLVRDNARAMLSKYADIESLKKWEASDTGYDAELWSKIASLGWLGVGITGDDDADLLSLGIIIEEIGRAAFPSPLLTTVAECGYALNALATGPEAARTLDSIHSGAPASFISGPVVRLQQGLLQSSPVVCQWPHAASVLVILAHDGDGYCLATVDPAQPGVHIEQRDTVDNERVGVVTLTEVPPADLPATTIGPEKVRRMLSGSRLLRSAELLGGAQASLDLTVEYVKTRHQFGVPIGSFQAVQHQLADVAIAVDAARLATYEGLSELTRGVDVSRSAALSALLCSRASSAAAEAGAQFHGGIGTIRDHRMNVYYRRSIAMSLRLGPDPDLRAAITRTHITPAASTRLGN